MLWIECNFQSHPAKTFQSYGRKSQKTKTSSIPMQKFYFKMLIFLEILTSRMRQMEKREKREKTKSKNVKRRNEKIRRKEENGGKLHQSTNKQMTKHKNKMLSLIFKWIKISVSMSVFKFSLSMIFFYCCCLVSRSVSFISYEFQGIL